MLCLEYEMQTMTAKNKKLFAVGEEKKEMKINGKLKPWMAKSNNNFSFVLGKLYVVYFLC